MRSIIATILQSTWYHSGFNAWSWPVSSVCWPCLLEASRDWASLSPHGQWLADLQTSMLRIIYIGMAMSEWLFCIQYSTGIINMNLFMKFKAPLNIYPLDSLLWSLPNTLCSFRQYSRGRWWPRVLLRLPSSKTDKPSPAPCKYILECKCTCTCMLVTVTWGCTG